MDSNAAPLNTENADLAVSKKVEEAQWALQQQQQVAELEEATRKVEEAKERARCFYGTFIV